MIPTEIQPEAKATDKTDRRRSGSQQTPSSASSSASNTEAASLRAQTHWDHLRHSDRMRRALAGAHWSELVIAYRTNDSRLREATWELEAAKRELAELDALARKQAVRTVAE